MDWTLICTKCAYIDKFAITKPVFSLVIDLIQHGDLFTRPIFVQPICPECSSKKLEIPFLFRKTKQFGLLPSEKQNEISNYIADEIKELVANCLTIGILLLLVILLAGAVYFIMRPTNWSLYE